MPMRGLQIHCFVRNQSCDNGIDSQPLKDPTSLFHCMRGYTSNVTSFESMVMS